MERNNNEIYWVSECGMSYSLRSPRTICWFKDWNSGCKPRLTLPVGSWRNIGFPIFYLLEEQTIAPELWSEFFDGDSDNIT